MRANTDSVAPPPPGQAPSTNATSPHRDGNKRFCSVPCVPSFHFENSFYAGNHWFPERLEVFLWCRVGTRSLARGRVCRTPTGTHSYSTTTHCKIYLSLAPPFLLCCNASLFFSHFTSLCCAVVDFVAGIVHGVLFDIFCFGLVIHHTLI